MTMSAALGASPWRVQVTVSLSVMRGALVAGPPIWRSPCVTNSRPRTFTAGPDGADAASIWIFEKTLFSRRTRLRVIQRVCRPRFTCRESRVWPAPSLRWRSRTHDAGVADLRRIPVPGTPFSRNSALKSDTAVTVCSRSLVETVRQPILSPKSR